MTDLAGRVARKLRSEGLSGAFRAAGRTVHSVLFATDWELELIPSLLEQILAAKPEITLVQIGANVGKTASDPIYGFLRKHFYKQTHGETRRCRAILVEPVRHLYQKLVENYSGFQGIVCENVALAEVPGTKRFYRLREGINPAEHGLDPWAEQLGSFLPDKLSSLWINAADPERARKFVVSNTVVEDIECITFTDLVEKHRLETIDLLQIDTEGYDYQILRTIDFARIRPKYINYERIHLGKDEAKCRNLMLDQQYRLHDHGQDTLCTLEPNQGGLKRAGGRLYNRWLDLIH